MKKLSRVLLILFIGLTLIPLLISHAQAVWQPNTWYNVNDLVTYNGSVYKCIQAHTSLVGWEPPNVPALWGLQSGSPATNTPAPTTAPTKTNTPSGATATKTNTPMTATATKTPTFVPTIGATATSSSSDGSPYNGSAATVPGKIEAENYNTGGEGVAYHDADTANQGGAYRTGDGVDLESCTESGCGYDIGWTASGEWEKYTVNVTSPGTYSIDFRVASAQSGSGLHLEIDGSNVTGDLVVANTGGWQNWTTITKSGVSFSAGNHVLRLYVDNTGYNINWINVYKPSSATATFTNTPASSNGGGTKQSTYFTSYGYNDNDDGNGHFGTAVIAYPDNHHAIATEGAGTFADPVTFATDSREIPSHTMIYVPYLQKYFYMEDGCAECTTDWDNGHKWRTDLFMGGNTAMQPEPALSNCEDYVTRNDIMYINAGAGYPVDTTPLFSNGQCTAMLH